MCGCAFFRLTARKQIWAWPADGVLDEVGYEGCEQHADEEGKEGDVEFVEVGAGDGEPDYHDDEGDATAVEEHHC